MARASRRTPRTPPTPGKARRITPTSGPDRSTRTIDLQDARTVGEVCARIAASIDVPLRGEDDASAVRRLTHALANDSRPCAFVHLASLPPELRRTLDEWTARVPRRRLRPQVDAANDHLLKRTNDSPGPAASAPPGSLAGFLAGSLARSPGLPAWRDPHLDLALRMVQKTRTPAPAASHSSLRLSARASTGGAPSPGARSSSVDDALHELLALLPALRRRGPLGIELDLLDEWLDAARDAHADPWLRARTLMARGDALRLLGRLEEARIDLEEARSLARGEASLESAVIALLGRLHHHGARHEEAQMHYERALALAAESHDVALRIDTLLDLATLLRDTSQPRDALPYAERALALAVHEWTNRQKNVATELGDAHEDAAIRRARAAALVATLLHAEALHEEARAAYATAIEAAHLAGEGALAASSLANLGLLARQAALPFEARDALVRAADRFARLGMASAEGRSRLAAALAIVDVDPASAVESAEDAATLFAPGAAAADASSAHAAHAVLAFAHAEAADRAAARAACSAAFAAPARDALSTLVRARLLVADAVDSDRAGANDRAGALRREAYQMYESTKADLAALAATTTFVAEISDANGAARSLLRSLERALSSPSSRITPPSDRPSKTRRFF